MLKILRAAFCVNAGAASMGASFWPLLRDMASFCRTEKSNAFLNAVEYFVIYYVYGLFSGTKPIFFPVTFFHPTVQVVSGVKRLSR